jgi:hypothetical protein
MSFSSTRDAVCLGSAGLAIGSTTSGFSTARAVTVALNGRAVNAPAVATRAFTAGLTSLAINQACAFFIVADSAGALNTVQSPIVIGSGAGYVAGGFDVPNPATGAVVGAIVIKAGGAVFVPGTTALTGVATYYDLALDYGVPIPY